MSQPLASFQVDMLDATYALPPGTMVTPALRYRASAIAGWGMPNTDFSDSTHMGTEVPGGEPYAQLVALFDAYGNQLPSFNTLPWQQGRNEGAAIFKILRPMMPGGNFTDVVIRATYGPVSGTGAWCKVTYAAAPPASHVYGITAGGQRLATPPLTDPVVIDQDGRVIWQSGPYTSPIVGRTGSW